MALNLAPFGRWTLRDKAAQRRLALRSGDASRPPKAPRLARAVRDALRIPNQRLHNLRLLRACR